LYPRTKEREIVTTIPFEPISVTVSGGWLCCGGHHGNYTAIPLDDRRSGFDFSGLEPDARLPVDFDPIRRSIFGESSSTSRRSRDIESPLSCDVQRFGIDAENKENDAINNCITLWFPPSSSSNLAYKKPVALLANNDKSLYVLDLEESEVLQRVTYPDCCNRAEISPDGELLVAVLDDAYLYIHQRKLSSDPSPGLFNTKDNYKWAPSSRIQLHPEPKIDDESGTKGSFALSFSSSGKYLAAATQYGKIYVFEVDGLTREDTKPVAVFFSSRPGLRGERDIPGAVRCIAFSNGPIDLLAWTESNGRVGVADVRNLFLSRQLVLVDSRLDDAESVQVTEREKSADSPFLDPQLRPLRTESISSTPDYLGLDFSQGRLLRDRHQSSLTRDDLEILQAHRIARRQRDVAADPAGTMSVAGHRASSQSTTGASSSPIERRISTAGLPAAIRDFVNPEHRTAASFRSFINERNQDRERRNQQETRNRSSVLAATERILEQESLGANGSTTTLERLTLTPSRLSGSETPSNPWAEIDALYRARFPGPGSQGVERSARIRIELEDDEGLRRPWRPLGELGIGPRDDSNTIILRSRHDDDHDGVKPPETTGLAWSPDGRTL
jgi:WD40 repeat protein